MIKWQWASMWYQHPETEAAEWNSAIFHLIIYTWHFPPVTCVRNLKAWSTFQLIWPVICKAKCCTAKNNKSTSSLSWDYVSRAQLNMLTSSPRCFVLAVNKSDPCDTSADSLHALSYLILLEYYFTFCSYICIETAVIKNTDWLEQISIIFHLLAICCSILFLFFFLLSIYCRITKSNNSGFLVVSIQDKAIWSENNWPGSSFLSSVWAPPCLTCSPWEGKPIKT